VIIIGCVFKVKSVNYAKHVVRTSGWVYS